MSRVSMLFSTFLLSILFLQPIQAEQANTIILSDRYIKEMLASQGLNFDSLWSKIINDDNVIDENSLAELSNQISSISFTHHGQFFASRPSSDIAENIQTLLGKTILKTDDDENNAICFNTALKFNSLHILYDPASPVSCFFQHIGSAICSYLTSKAIENRLRQNAKTTKDHLYLFIKITIDAEKKSVVLETAPKISQEGFVKTYTDEDIAQWFTENWKNNDNSSAGQSLIDSSHHSLRPEKESTCYFLTRYLGLSLVTIGIISLMIPDAWVAPINAENLSAISEYFDF